MPSICLSVCLLAVYVKTTEWLFTKIFTTDVSMVEEELITFWKSSAFWSGSRNFLKDSSTLWDRAFFHNLAYISGEWRIFMKILSHMYSWTAKYLLNIGCNPDSDMDSGSRPNSPWQGYVCSFNCKICTYVYSVYLWYHPRMDSDLKLLVAVWRHVE